MISLEEIGNLNNEELFDFIFNNGKVKEISILSIKNNEEKGDD